ncbi:hypothetical protein BX600DRAFT_486812 [Xylariales sp. PMI_506]|nr:hypothetical protein BX600DRAFT_486812 [Xylariales sp. PMI_506]
MATNTAVWITAPCARPFEVKPAPLVAPGENETLIKNKAVAINPLDGRLLETDFFKLKYPTIFGLDVAGEEIEGDRVMGNASGFSTNRDAEKGFPDLHHPEDRHAQPPSPTSSRWSALSCSRWAYRRYLQPCFMNEFVGQQQLPVVEAGSAPISSGKTLLVWGGASPVAASYQVISTTSPKNADYVRKLDASHVFGYNSPTVVSDIVKARIMSPRRSRGVKIATTVVNKLPQGNWAHVKQSHAPMIMGTQVSKAIWEDFVPKTLETGRLTPAPEALVAGKGLESIQGAVDLQRKATSAQKVVVLLSTIGLRKGLTKILKQCFY